MSAALALLPEDEEAAALLPGGFLPSKSSEALAGLGLDSVSGTSGAGNRAGTSTAAAAKRSKQAAGLQPPAPLPAPERKAASKVRFAAEPPKEPKATAAAPDPPPPPPAPWTDPFSTAMVVVPSDDPYDL